MKQAEKEREDGEIGIFHNPSKILKLNANNLWGIQTAQRDATEGFSLQNSIRLLSKAWFVCVLLGGFHKFPVDC